MCYGNTKIIKIAKGRIVKKTKYFILIILFILLSVTFIYAEDDKTWNPVSAGPATTWTAPLCGKGKFVAQPFLVYEKTRGTFNSEGHYDSLPDEDRKYAYKQQLFMQYGIAEKLEIDAQIEYQQVYAKQSGNRAYSEGFGDSYFFLRHCAADEDKRHLCVTFLAQLKVPTGKYQKANTERLGTDLMGAETGGGSYEPGGGVNLTKAYRPFILHADALYAVPQKVKVDGLNTRYGRYLIYDFGAEYFLNKGFNLILEFNGMVQDDKIEDGAKSPSTDSAFFAFSPGIGWSSEKVQTLFAYQRILKGTNRDAKDSLILTFVYSF